MTGGRSSGTGPEPADRAFHHSRYGCYQLTRVHHVDGYVLRIRVYRDSYGFQSDAVAEVLTPQRTWTEVATESWTRWYHTTTAEAVEAALTPVADNLLRRARRILHPPPPEASPDR